MDIYLILRVAGVGFFVAILDKILKSSGKDSWTPIVDMVGVVIVLLMVLDLINKLFVSVRTIFQL